MTNNARGGLARTVSRADRWTTAHWKFSSGKCARATLPVLFSSSVCRLLSKSTPYLRVSSVNESPSCRLHTCKILILRRVHCPENAGSRPLGRVATTREPLAMTSQDRPRPANFFPYFCFHSIALDLYYPNHDTVQHPKKTLCTVIVGPETLSHTVHTGWYHFFYLTPRQYTPLFSLTIAVTHDSQPILTPPASEILSSQIALANVSPRHIFFSPKTTTQIIMLFRAKIFDRCNTRGIREGWCAS